MKSDKVDSSHKWLQLPDETVAIYNAHDTVATARLAQELPLHMEKNSQESFYRQWFDEMVPVVRAMQRRGVGQLDYEARNKYREQLRKEIREIEKPILQEVKLFEELENEAHQWAQDYAEANPTHKKRVQIGLASRLRKVEKRRKAFFNRGGSRDKTDLASFLYDQLDLKAPPKTRDRPAFSTSQDALYWVLQHLRKKDQPHIEILHNLFHRSRLNTILTRYMTIEAEEDGRVRPTIKLYGTETLRLAYAGDSGEALQQWPPEARHVIRARPGFVFISRDYSQLEARIMAYLSGDGESITTFEGGGDIHRSNAMDLFGYSESDWESLDPVQQSATRNFAKTFLYGVGFGGSPSTLHMKLFCPCYRCIDKVPPSIDLKRRDIIEAGRRWANKHQPIIKWREELFQSVKGYGMDHSWTSPFGYRRIFLESPRDAERSIYNNPMQHCAAMIVNRAMVQMQKENIPVVLQMHDEIVVETTEIESEWAAKRMGEIMETPVPELGGVSFPTDKAISDNWGGLK